MFRSPAVMLAMALVCGPAFGQAYVRAPCPTGAPPNFETRVQSQWYRRFWTGECKGLPVFGCISGKPNWNDVVTTMAARATADQQANVTARVCRLGRRIGLEWTRPKTERCIDTRELKALNAALRQAPTVTAGLAAVEARVKARIGA
jgi:hypothetical protein